MNTIHIQLNFQQLIDVVKQLSPAEKIKLNQVIWADNTTIPLEHQKLVLKRIAKSKQGSNMMLDWEDALKTLD